MAALRQTAKILLLASQLAFAAQDDLAGSQDHPLVSRYPDTHIIQYRSSAFDEFALPIAPSVSKEGTFVHPTKHLEGKVTTIEYQTNTKTPYLQVVRNYETALKQSGFKTLFTCNGREECGPLFVGSLLGEQWREEKLTFGPSNSDSSGANRFHYWSGSLARTSGEVFVSVLTGENLQYPGPVEIVLDIIETKPMESGLVSVNPKFLSDSLASEGKVVLQGIFFDTDKATIKPESSAALKAISDYLNQNKSTKVFIVGHTDTSGDYSHNVDLSGQRAKAVTDALIAAYKIDRNRLRAVGVGPVAPAGSNSTEEGKAKNRRVEMVLD